MRERGEGECEEMRSVPSWGCQEWMKTLCLDLGCDRMHEKNESMVAFDFRTAER